MVKLHRPMLKCTRTAAARGTAGTGSAGGTALYLDDPNEVPGADSAEVREDGRRRRRQPARTRQRAASGKRRVTQTVSQKGDDAALEVFSLDNASRRRCRQEQQGSAAQDRLVAYVVMQHRLTLPNMAQADDNGDFEGGVDAQ